MALDDARAAAGQSLTITFVNDTPLKLALRRKDKPEASLEALASVSRPATSGESWSLVETGSNVLLKTFQPATATDDCCVVTERDIVSTDQPELQKASYVNRTTYSVDLLRLSKTGTEERFATLEPEEKITTDLPAGQAVIVRALVTQEVVAAQLTRQEPEFVITDAFRVARRRQLQPPPRPRFGTLKLIEQVRETEEPDSRLYTHISVQELGKVSQFNTRPDVLQRRIRLSGATLVFDRTTDNRYGLMSLQGQLDIKTLEIYADRLIIRSPLHLPGTDVVIHARELRFEGNGSITTTPIPFPKATALSPVRTVDNHPGKKVTDPKTNAVTIVPTYETADGAHGEKAGDVVLHVRRMTEDRHDPKTMRFTCCGTDGQEGEPGGIKRYVAPEDKPEYVAPQGITQSGPSVTPTVTVQGIKDYLQKNYSAKDPAQWRWPTVGGETDSPDKIVLPGDAKNALQAGKVAHLTLIGCDDTAFTNITGLGSLPAGTHVSTYGDAGSLARMWGLTKQHPDAKRPGDAPESYPPGQSGNGGKGGTITVFGPNTLQPDICDLKRGQGGPSKDASVGQPGTPYPAYWVRMIIVKRSLIDSVVTSPGVYCEDVSGKVHASQKARPGATPKEDGKIVVKDDEPLGWMNRSRPLGLESVLACARDAYRNGQRDKARALIEPYHALFIREEREKGTVPPLLAGLYGEIAAMQTNMAGNLDYYGHPVGWLPRLNLSTTYKLWQAERQNASKLLYYTMTLKDEWSKAENRRGNLENAAKAVTSEMTLIATQLLPEARDNLDKAQKDFVTVAAKVDGKAQEIETLRVKVAKEAKDRIAAQKAFSAFCKIAAGLMEAVPVGQPYLGLAGKSLSTIGDFDWNKPNPMEGASKALAELGAIAGTFLTQNKDTILADSASSLQSKVEAAKSSVATLEKSVTDYQADLKKTWETYRTEKAAELQKQIATLGTDITTLKESDKDLLKVWTELEKELDGGKNKLQIEGLQELRERLEKEVKALSDAKGPEATFKKDIVDKIADLEKQKAEYKKNIGTYTEDVDRRKKKTGELLTSLKGLSDGVGKIAKGIAIASAPLDDAEVKRLMDEILKDGEYRDVYLKLLDELKALNLEKAQAVLVLGGCSQRIADYVTQIGKSLSEIVAISDQRQVVDEALDAGLMHYMDGMEKRAKERLLAYQYNFAKAYEYEFLASSAANFLNLDNWVDRLRRAKAALDTGKKLADVALDKTVRLSESDFKQCEEMLAKDQLATLADTIAQQRLRSQRTESTFVVSLPGTHLKELLRDGKLTLRLPDLKIGSYEEYEAKISSLVLDKFTVYAAGVDYTKLLSPSSPYANDEAKHDAVDAVLNNLVLDIDFEHSGESILRQRGSGQCYYFQRAQDEAPITWGFTYNGLNSPKVTPDTVAATDVDTMFHDTPVQYKEYFPALYGDVTLWINRKLHDGPKANADDKLPIALQELLAGISEIGRVKLTVKIVRFRR